MGDEYRRFELASRSRDERDWLLAEAFEAGAEGAEERDETTGAARPEAPAGAPSARASEAARARPFTAWVYVGAEQIEAVREVLVALGTDAFVGEALAVEAVDWSEAWKAGLGPIVISERLVVRPPFAPFALAPGQVEIVIDPGQAFGTGTHASTQLCLEWIDALMTVSDGRARPMNVLDVGTGSGVLALAAAALGATSALGFDLDPVAIDAARDAARINGLADRVHFFCGPIESVASRPEQPLIVVNLLKRELLPIAPALAERLDPGGSLILAGLLEEDAADVAARFAPLGLVEVERRARTDAVGCWIAPRYVVAR